MFHPRRSLQDLVDGELPDRRRSAVEHHIQDCERCTADLARLRGHKSALLGLRRPAPDPDFQRKLLSSGSSAVPSASRGRGDDPASGAGGTSRGRRRLLAVGGGSAAVIVTVLTAGYVVGSGAQPERVGAAGDPTALTAAWAELAPGTAAELDVDELQALRAAGWSCPELTSLGFTLSSAEGLLVGGLPTLELVLDHHGDRVAVYEQRKTERSAHEPPVNAATGRTVTEDGFDHVGGVEQDLWVRSGDPWLVVLDSPSVTFTVVSELAPAAMPQALHRLVSTEYAQLAPQQRQGGSVTERIHRGLSIIIDPGHE